MNAVHYRWPKALIQFEDFNTKHAATILSRYKHRLCFNDDIQGTGATALAGLLCAIKYQGPTASLKDQRFVVVGAGSAGMGVAAAVHSALMKEGLSSKVCPDSHACPWFCPPPYMAPHRRCRRLRTGFGLSASLG